MRLLTALALIFLAAYSPATVFDRTPTENQVQVQLVLVVDTSPSIGSDELIIQRQGYAKAIRSEEFVMQATKNWFKRIAVAYFEYSHGVYQPSDTGWHIIDGHASADRLASRIEGMDGRQWTTTYLGVAMRYAHSLLIASPYRSNNRIIDMSGDGCSADPLAAVREMVLADGILINGLALTYDPDIRGSCSDIVEYYKKCVTGGPGSYTWSVDSIEKFEQRIKEKLITEISMHRYPLYAQAGDPEEFGIYDEPTITCK